MPVSITKRINSDGKTVRWRCQVRVAGHPSISRTFSRKQTAKTWGRVEEDRLKQIDPRMTHTVGEAIDDFLEVRPQSPTHRFDFWRDRVGDIRLCDFTAAIVSDALHDLRKTPTDRGRTRGPSTINRYHAAISAVLNHAHRDRQWVADNVARQVSRRAEPPGRTRWLSDDERRRLIDACASSHWSGMLPLVMLALSTGARVSELEQLRWSDVDTDSGTAYIAKSKNSDPRTLPIKGPALGILRRYEADRGDSALLFPATRGHGSFNWRKAWAAALREAGITNFRFHDLRHTAASYLAQQGASTVEIADVLGHRTLQMVKRYAHLNDTHKHALLAQMTERFEGDDSSAGDLHVH